MSGDGLFRCCICDGAERDEELLNPLPAPHTDKIFAFSATPARKSSIGVPSCKFVVFSTSTPIMIVVSGTGGSPAGLQQGQQFFHRQGFDS